MCVPSVLLDVCHHLKSLLAVGSMELNDSLEKKCPFCAETIKKEAIVCRYCSRDLPNESSASHALLASDVEDKVSCIACHALILKSTAKRFKGKCAMCHKSSKSLFGVSSTGGKRTSSKPKCPRCQSTEIAYNKKGFGAGKAVVGGVLTGGIGILAGFIGSNKILATCVSCGHSWKI